MCQAEIRGARPKAARAIPCAKGWLGQYLCVDRDHDIVAVRMRKRRFSDHEDGGASLTEPD